MSVPENASIGAEQVQHDARDLLHEDGCRVDQLKQLLQVLRVYQDLVALELNELLSANQLGVCHTTVCSLQTGLAWAKGSSGYPTYSALGEQLSRGM